MSAPERYVSRAAALPGPAWWNTRREGALSRFTGFPNRKVEDFKYTDVRYLADGDRAFRPALEVVSGEVLSLDDALKSEWIAEYLDQTEALAVAPFRALNTAVASEGAVIRVPAGQTHEPVELRWNLTDGETHARVLIVLEAGAKATLVETYGGDAVLGAKGTGGFLNQVTEVFLAPGAELSVHALQDAPAGSTLVRRTEVTQREKSVLKHGHLDVGGGLVRHDLHVRLIGEQARCDLDGAYLVGRDQHVDIHARIDHVAPRCDSSERYTGVLGANGRGVFNGTAYVHKDAQQTNAEQQNRNLLLSADAEIDTKPQLEIYADDVKCSHGATVGALDDDALFYLRTRGIPLDEARAILTRGFIIEVLEEFPPEVFARAELLVDAALDGLLEVS